MRAPASPRLEHRRAPLSLARVNPRAGHATLWSVCACLLVQGCTTSSLPTAPVERAGAPATKSTSAAAAFEQAQRERAQTALRQGRLADAAQAWELLLIVKPQSIDYRDALAEVRGRIEAGVADRLQRAAVAQRRGDAAGAEQQFLAVLALQPENDAAAAALRAIERERNRRLYLGKPSRLTITRRPLNDLPVAAISGTDSNDLEHATMLADQGDVDEAISVLERRIGRVPQDMATRRLLADVCYRKALTIMASDKPQAITLLRRSVLLDRNHPEAARELQKALAVAPVR